MFEFQVLRYKKEFLKNYNYSEKDHIKLLINPLMLHKNL